MKVTQLCLTLCDPMDYTAYGIHQARILEWVAVPFSRGFSNPGIKRRSPTLQADSLLAEPLGKPRNTGVCKPIPSLVDIPDPAIELGSPAFQVDSLPSEL